MKAMNKQGVKRLLALVLLVVMSIACLTACGTKKKSITVNVVDSTGTTSTFTGKTDAEFLGDALNDMSGVVVEGYESDWGFYITTVNGETADYENDGAYWSIYVNGEYGMYGVDTQPVADGDTYSFVYEVWSY